MSIKVRATDMGHYGHLRQSGEEFEIKDEKAFSARWMEFVDPKQTVSPGVKEKLVKEAVKRADLKPKAEPQVAQVQAVI